MVLRNVAKTDSLEEQRQEINLLAADVNAISTDLSADTSPQLSADLDLNGNNITGATPGISISPTLISSGSYSFVGSGTPGGGNPSGDLEWNGSDNKLYFGDAYLTRDSNGVGWIGSSGTMFLSAANGVTVTNEGATETYFVLNAGSNTALYHNTTAKLTTAATGVEIFGNIVVSGTVDGRDLDTDGSKLDGIETGATADQTDAEIKTAYENNADTNAFTDALQTKLSGIETGATADQTGAEIKTAYEGEADTNAFTDAEQTKLSGIEAGATVNAATGGTSGGIGTQADPQYGSVQFRGGTNTLLGDSVFVYDTTNNKLGIGIQQPKNELHILKGVDGGDVSLRITNQSSVDAGTSASIYLGTSPSDTFNTFYIRTLRDGGATHLGYSDPDAANHDPNIILPSAGGLEFGTQTDTETTGSTKSSATLDHYEEGTWTPQWGSTTGSITNVTYDVQSGWYTRIGRVVYVSCRLRSTATDTSGAGGGLLVSGLPFVARTPQGTGAGAAYSLIDFPAGTINITTEVRENTTQFYAGLYTLDNGNFGNIGPGSLQSSGNSEIRVSFFYMTDS